MTADYQTLLAQTTRALYEASVAVGSELAQRHELSDEALWVIEGEVLWTYLGSAIDAISATNAAARWSLRADLVSHTIACLVETSFRWPPDSLDMQRQQFEAFEAQFEAAVLADAESAALPLDPAEALSERLSRRIVSQTGPTTGAALLRDLVAQVSETATAMSIADSISILVARQAQQA